MPIGSSKPVYPSNMVTPKQANVPSMNISECAKLIKRSTP